MVVLLYIVYERLITEFSAPWSRIFAGKVPITLMVGDGFAQSLYGLEDQRNGGGHFLRAKHLYNLLIDFLYRERFVQIPHAVALPTTKYQAWYPLLLLTRIHEPRSIVT